MACCSSCSCWPCQCSSICAETEEGYCDDPGVVTSGLYASVLNDELCERRLTPWRGLDEDGNVETDTGVDLRAAFNIQDANGAVRWSDQPGIDFPETEVLDMISGHLDGAERSLVGPDGEAKDLRWNGTQWVLVDPPGGEEGSTCTELSSTFTLDPEDDTYVVIVESTENFVEGASAMVGGYEFFIDEVIDGTHLRLRPNFTPGGIEDIEGGSSLCMVGFRPCADTTEDNPDTLMFCHEGRPVAITPPEDVQGKTQPFGVWFGQDGAWHVIEQPVDEDTGLPLTGYVLTTNNAPVDGQPNIPEFVQSGGQSDFVTNDRTGSALAWQDLDFTLPAGVPEYMVRLDVFLEGVVGGGGYVAGMYINGDLIRNNAPGSSILSGWGGAGLIQHYAGDATGSGFAIGSLEPGDHTFSFQTLFGSINATFINVTVSYWPKT